jgi:RecA/RadA recombinase
MTKANDPIDTLIGKVNAKLNAGVPKKEWKSFVARADDVWSPFILRRPTGIIGIDRYIGGGWPAGGISHIAAPEGVGKNALVLQTIAECQRRHGNKSRIAWATTEFPIDKLYAQSFGVVIPMSDMEIRLENKARGRDNRARLTKKQTARMKRSLGRFLILDTGSTAQRFEAVVDLVKSNLFQIIVVDSMGAILTEQREEKVLGEFAQQSSEAFLVTEFQKKLWGAFGDPSEDEVNWTSLMVINQIRGNRNAGTFGRKWTVGGAHALKHAKLVDLWMTRGEPIKGKVPKGDDSEKTVKIGKKVKWEITKGKAGCHEGPTGIVDYYYKSGFQIEKDLVDNALDAGVVIRTGKAQYALIDEDGTVVEEIYGKSNLYNTAYDEEWFRAVYDLILRKDGVSCIYTL